jgi:hypothetical protein
MKLTALMCCRNSDWCIGLSLRAALMWCDSAVVLLHSCTDRTQELVMEVARETNRVIVVAKDEPDWNEMTLRQSMLELARADGATHIALVDDDELISGNLLPIIRALVEHVPEGRILQLPWLCLRDGISSVMTTGLWSRATVSTAFRDDPAFHWAAQGPDGYQHHHRHPLGRPFATYEPVTERSGGLMHLQFSSSLRLRAKQWAYQLIEMSRWPNRKPASEVAAYYGRTVREAEAARVERVWSQWWQPYQHLMRYLDVDAEPWQLEQCRRMLCENPGIGRGLDSFGLG